MKFERVLKTEISKDGYCIILKILNDVKQGKVKESNVGLYILFNKYINLSLRESLKVSYEIIKYLSNENNAREVIENLLDQISETDYLKIINKLKISEPFVRSLNLLKENGMNFYKYIGVDLTSIEKVKLIFEYLKFSKNENFAMEYLEKIKLSH